MTSYRVIGNDAIPAGIGADYMRARDGWSVVRCEGGTIVEWIACDGGEPEDQLLVRDWDWVPRALQAAHDRGSSEAAALRARVDQLEAALRRIATEHQAYDVGPSESLGTHQYKIGVTDGHRCAAAIARAALGD